jgi:CRISPR-associated endonuclease/helicase Cas3
VERDDFAKFFAAVNGGNVPFAWQERLLDSLLGNRRWPGRIDAPTGAGKTSAIDVHVFAIALTATSSAPRLPRRLAMVVNRRVLVDDQYQHARQLADLLNSTPDDLAAEIADRLRALEPALRPVAADPAGPLVTARLRGGSVPPRSWRDHPTACTVLCATPDMWGSRLLFGGYGTSRRAAPCEAGLLAFDTAVLVDEAHLARQLTVTARRVSQLAAIAERPIAGVPVLQVTEVSATPASSATSASSAGPELVTLGVTAGDLAGAGGERLRARLTRAKPVRLLPVPGWLRSSRLVTAAIAQAVTEMKQACGGPETIGCFVNTVPMALAVADALRKEALTVVTVCGQLRPADLARLAREYPGVLTTGGNSAVDVVVTTQSLEVGADLDFVGMVTELAPGSALAQRAGRVNRLGERASGPVTVIVPEAEKEPGKVSTSGPYKGEELAAGLEWLSARVADPRGLAPWAVRETPPPQAEPRRMLYQRPELADSWHWARTSDDLAADPELELWLSDSLEPETSVGIIVRDAVPDDPGEAAEFIRDLPPADREVFTVPYQTAWDVVAEQLDRGIPAVRVRGDDITPLAAGNAGIRPGDVVVIDSSAAIVTLLPDGGFSPPVVASAGLANRGQAADVLHDQPDPRPGTRVLRLEWSDERKQVAGVEHDVARLVLTEVADGWDDRSPGSRRTHLAGLLQTLPASSFPADLRPAIDEIIKLLRARVKDSDLILRDLSGGGLRLVVIDRRRAVADEDLRQAYTPGDNPVPLVNHQEAVGARAAELGSALGLPSALTERMRLAGKHHDDGKADTRFQTVRLGVSSPDVGEPLAKSPPGSTVPEVREHEGEGGLPSRWRHEQRSVVDAWSAVRAEDGDPELALRLIGTSHGYGRSGFPHGLAGLAGQDEAADWISVAAGLFDHGEWDELIETTHIRYGVWGCAFLEALLRAADCQVSAEGS